MLVGIAKIRMLEDVLVVGASSGVGIAAVQIAKLFHCRVIATAGGEEKMAKARELGADHVIDHYRQDIRAEVRAINPKTRCRHRLRARRPGHLEAFRRQPGA